METARIILKILGTISFIFGIIRWITARNQYISSHNKVPVPSEISNKCNVFFFIGIFLIVLSNSF